MTPEEREQVRKVRKAVEELGDLMFQNPRFTEEDMRELGGAYWHLGYMLDREAQVRDVQHQR